MVPIALQSLPPGVTVKPLFDQSLFVRASIDGVLREGLTAAALTAGMILLFLGDWRPTIVISISIPLSIFVSVLLLSALGETINIMTLGGLALAVGILVDDATVEIENIERNLAQGKEMKQAILDGAPQIAVPAFVSTLVDLHRVRAHVLPDRRGALSCLCRWPKPCASPCWRPISCRELLIPTLVMYIMRGHEHRAAGPKTIFGRFQRGFERGFEQLPQRLLPVAGNHAGASQAFRRSASSPSACFPWAGVFSGPGFLSQRRCRPDAPACARSRRLAGGGNGAAV